MFFWLLCLGGVAFFLWRRQRSSDRKSARDIHEIKERLESAIRRLQKEKQETDAVLGAMAEPVFAVDFGGKILFLNSAAEKLFEVSSSDAGGKNFLEIVRHARISQLIQTILTEGGDRTESVVLPGDQERYFDARASVLQDRENRHGVLVVLHDMTEIQRLEQVRRDFVANVSHELRTPLTSIQGFAETLLSGSVSDPKNKKEFLETIYKQSERLSMMVNDLLNLSVLESSPTQSEFKSVDLTALLKECSALLQPVAKSRDIRIGLNLPERSLSISGDRDQLKQVFLNLLDNAVKFNREQGTIQISVLDRDPYIEVRVQDSGIGIPEKDLSRIFERFYRVDKARSQDAGGTGLGLAIVKHIVENHGGSIQVESKENQGATFLLRLPSIP